MVVPAAPISPGGEKKDAPIGGRENRCWGKGGIFRFAPERKKGAKAGREICATAPQTETLSSRLEQTCYGSPVDGDPLPWGGGKGRCPPTHGRGRLCKPKPQFLGLDSPERDRVGAERKNNKREKKINQLLGKESGKEKDWPFSQEIGA